MTIHEEYTVWRGTDIAGFVRCTDDGWEFSRDGRTWNGANSSTRAQAVPMKPADYRLAA